MIDASNVVSIVRDHSYDQFDIFVDHLRNYRIDIFLTRINYVIGELQYVRGTIIIDNGCCIGEFNTNTRYSAIIDNAVIKTDNQLAQIIIETLNSCINEINE